MSLQNPKNDLISHMSGSSPSSPLIKTSTSDKYIKPSTLSQEDEEKLAKVPELPILTSSPIKNRVSRSSSEGNLRSTITNRALFDRGGLSYRETTTPDPLFPEDKKKKGFNTFKKLVMGGSNVDVNSAEKAQEKAERAQEKAEKKKDRLSFRLSQGANTHSKEKERLKSSKPTSRDDEEVPKDDSNPSQDKKLKGKSLENLQQSSTSPHGSSQSSKKHFS